MRRAVATCCLVTFDLDAISAENARDAERVVTGATKAAPGQPSALGAKMQAIDPANLAVVSIVQDDRTQHVLQANYLPVRPPTAQGKE